MNESVRMISRLATKGPKYGFKLEGICTHMCDAGSKSYTLKELGRFTQVVKELRYNNIEVCDLTLTSLIIYTQHTFDTQL